MLSVAIGVLLGFAGMLLYLRLCRSAPSPMRCGLLHRWDGRRWVCDVRDADGCLCLDRRGHVVSWSGRALEDERRYRRLVVSTLEQGSES